MKFHPLEKSSNIEGAHFDPATGVLTVKFRSGGVYHYDGCKQDHYDALCAAESAGKYLNGTIKNAFKHRKAEAEKKQKDAA